MPELTPHQIRILEVLARRSGWTTRQDIIKATLNPKGYSKAMGAPTRGKVKRNTLEGLGLVERNDIQPPFQYKITDAGRAALKRVAGLPF